MDQCLANKGIAKTMGAIGRIGDDMFGQWFVRLEEVGLTVTKISIN
jgi:hypothetical protein